MKRIITCSDGTWNKPGKKDRGVDVKTNVEKLHEAITPLDKKGNKQLKFYDQGVGTGASLTDELMGGATGKGIDKNILDAYKFILWNFEPGDELYHFGFSRGAYTARSLVGFIRYCGILRSEYLPLANEAYQLYRDQTRHTGPDSDLMVTFRERYSQETGIKFIGVWDTVGSLGIPLKAYKRLNTAKYQFHDTKLSSIVEYAYHALAINEKRKLFSPTLWRKSDSVLRGDSQQVMEQVWFTGVHSNVGGGYAETGLSDIALDWMIDKATEPEVGLSIDKSLLKNFHPHSQGELRNSLSLLYRILGRRWRDVCKSKDGNESIHPKVWERYKRSGEVLPPNLKGIEQRHEIRALSPTNHS